MLLVHSVPGHQYWFSEACAASTAEGSATCSATCLNTSSKASEHSTLQQNVNQHASLPRELPHKAGLALHGGGWSSGSPAGKQERASTQQHLQKPSKPGAQSAMLKGGSQKGPDLCRQCGAALVLRYRAKAGTPRQCFPEHHQHVEHNQACSQNKAGSQGALASLPDDSTGLGTAECWLPHSKMGRLCVHSGCEWMSHPDEYEASTEVRRGLLAAPLLPAPPWNAPLGCSSWKTDCMPMHPPPAPWLAG